MFGKGCALREKISGRNREGNGKMKYQLIIFDFDGTLADTFPWFAGIINEIAEVQGFKKINDAEAAMLRGYTVRAILQYLEVPLWKLPTLARHVQKMMSVDIDKIKLFAGAEFMLRTLADHGLTLALVSSNSQGNVQRILGEHNRGLFASYECGVSMLGKHAKLRKIIRKNGAEPERTLAVGDEIRDIEAAKRVGAVSGSVSWGYNSFEALVANGPDECFCSMKEITEHILGSG